MMRKDKQYGLLLLKDKLDEQEFDNLEAPEICSDLKKIPFYLARMINRSSKTTNDCQSSKYMDIKSEKKKEKFSVSERVND